MVAGHSLPELPVKPQIPTFPTTILRNKHLKPLLLHGESPKTASNKLSNVTNRSTHTMYTNFLNGESQIFDGGRKYSAPIASPNKLPNVTKKFVSNFVYEKNGKKQEKSSENAKRNLETSWRKSKWLKSDRYFLHDEIRYASLTILMEKVRQLHGESKKSQKTRLSSWRKGKPLKTHRHFLHDEIRYANLTFVMEKLKTEE